VRHAQATASFSRSYWVIPGKHLAGYYPGAKDIREATAKLTALIYSGIRHVINLMEPDERETSGHRFVPYDEVMESIAAKMKISVTFDQLPIKDLSVPTEGHMTRILNQIDLCIKHGKPVYVHCLGGIGRTGTVVGCYLVRHGLATGKNVLEMIIYLRKDSEDSDRRSPETREQREMVMGWQKRN
jgi:protein tyrosine phosphatase